jgi:3,4-dihydroxy 2-butanone 4-phosphate synthase/GTP cyclohydrolase II
MAQPGGVLTRAGHTEAGCDLVRLAGLEPAAVIVEILNDDGTMARRPQLEEFARLHGLKLGTIADLIRYRLEKERSVERIAERDIATDFGPFRLYCYEDHVNGTVHLALVRGALGATGTPLVRVHLKDTVRDLVGAHDLGHSWSLRSAMQRIAHEGSGVVVLLRPHESPLEIAEAVRSGKRFVASPRVAGAQVLRTYGIGAQILRDLGITRMRVLSAPKQMHGLSAFGLEVAGYVDENG